MPVPKLKLKLETKVEFFHFYRALLRSASYLPDPFARSYWHSHIVQRFREYSPRRLQNSKAAFSFGRKKRSLQLPRVESLQTTCLNTLRRLRNAGDGDTDALQKAIEKAYGRSGKRKYNLLRPYLLPETLTDGDSVEELILSKRLGKDEKLNDVSKPHPAVIAIAGSQRQQPPGNMTALPIRRLELKVPETNAWGRSMPICRVRNMQKKFNQEMYDRIMPPLPRDEWERLRDLALGTTKWAGVVNRRVPVGYWKPDPDDDMRKPQPGNRRGQHKITERTMRRIWGRIFVQCPLVEQIPDTGKWKVEWGQLPTKLPEAREEEHGFLFEGIAGEQESKGYWSEYNRLKKWEIRKREMEELRQKAKAEAALGVRTKT